MNDVAPDQAGLASGVVNTAFMMGGALGLAVLASLAGGVTRAALAAGVDAKAALNSGYQLAFLIGALCAVAAAVVALVFLRPRPAPHGEPALAH
jgi:sugar phosphate permease